MGHGLRRARVTIKEEGHGVADRSLQSRLGMGHGLRRARVMIKEEGHGVADRSLQSRLGMGYGPATSVTKQTGDIGNTFIRRGEPQNWGICPGRRGTRWKNESDS